MPDSPALDPELVGRLVYADELRVGSRFIPPGKKRPVEVIAQLTDNDNGVGGSGYFEFACESPQGHSAVRLHRSQQVERVPR